MIKFRSVFERYEGSELNQMDAHRSRPPLGGMGARHRHFASIHDFLLRRQDGREMWVSQSIDPIIMEGRIVRHFAAFYDITDWVLREQQQIRGRRERWNGGSTHDPADLSRPQSAWRRKPSVASG
jgi:hypothetical protein